MKTEPTHMEKMVLDRILSLKNPQSNLQIAKHFSISRPTASKHIRALIKLGLVEPHARVGSQYFYGRPRTEDDPIEVRMVKMPRAYPERATHTKDATKLARQRSDSAALQNIWGSVVKV